MNYVWHSKGPIYFQLNFSGIPQSDNPRIDEKGVWKIFFFFHRNFHAFLINCIIVLKKKTIFQLNSASIFALINIGLTSLQAIQNTCEIIAK